MPTTWPSGSPRHREAIRELPPPADIRERVLRELALEEVEHPGHSQ